MHQRLVSVIGRGTLQRIQAGTKPRMESLERIADALETDVSALTVAPTFPIHESGYNLESLAHAVSERQVSFDPPKKVWEDLVQESITGRFYLAVHSEALAPKFAPGRLGLWEAGNTAEAGQPVLLQLADGAFHMRFFEPRSAASWAGVSAQPGFRPLTPETDGARVLARMLYVDWR